jgi:hypothetical protein
LWLLLQYGCTPLHTAIAQGHTEVVQQLLRAGAGVDAADMVRPPPPVWVDGGRSMQQLLPIRSSAAWVGESTEKLDVGGDKQS